MLNELGEGGRGPHISNKAKELWEEIQDTNNGINVTVEGLD